MFGGAALVVGALLVVRVGSERLPLADRARHRPARRRHRSSPLLPDGRDALAKQVALGTSLVVLALTIAMCVGFDAAAATRFQFVQQHDWIAAFGVHYAVGVDGIALVLIALVAVLVPVVILACWHDADRSRARHAVAATARPRVGRWGSVASPSGLPVGPRRAGAPSAPAAAASAA